MVKVCEVPGQPKLFGVTVMLAIAGVFEVLIVVNAGMLPVPLLERPIAALLLVQVYVLLAGLPVNDTEVEAVPAQITWLEIGFRTGPGTTVIVKASGVPEQPLAIGVTVILAIILAVLPFTAVKELIAPEPLEGRPMLG